MDSPGTDVASQASDPDSILSMYRSLIQLRASSPALSRGDLIPVTAADREVVAYLRSDGDAHALVVANLGTGAVEAPALTLDGGPLCGAPVPRTLVGQENVAAPAISPSGGFEDYVPVAKLAPREILILDLAIP